MDTSVIRNICIDSSVKYYNFLKENNKGIQEVNVIECDSIPDRDLIYRIRLAAKLFDVEAIYFKLFTNGLIYNTDQIQVLEYDQDKNILIIKPVASICGEFRDLRSADIKVVSDLTFLVERIRKWYEVNGSYISIPTKSSLLKEKFSDVSFLPGLTPSHNQIEALKNIFHYSFTYIWGAPGTGKTQFVLAYAILHYIKYGKRVAILAPTNNAVEQVMREVLRMTEIAGIARDKILRLGIPTHKFAEEYPEVCENRGIQKKLKELDKQIDIIERLQTFRNKERFIQLGFQCLGLFDHMAQSIKERLRVDETMEEQKRKCREVQATAIVIMEKIRENKRRQDILRRKIFSFFSWLFAKRTLQAKKLSELEEQLKELLTSKAYTEIDGHILNTELKELKSSAQRLRAYIDGQIKQIQEKFSTDDSLKVIVQRLGINGWEKTRAALQNALDTHQEEIQKQKMQFQDYEHYSEREIQTNLDKLLQIRSKFTTFSTEERIKNINVLACTLDGYIGRFTDKRMEVDHIFVDEAGYANIIKALTLFNHDVPITFLGDHMQLPPVCEINSSNIQRNDNYHNMFLWTQSAIHLEGIFCKTRDHMLTDYLNNASLSSIGMIRSDLNETYRFGANLARILDSRVYYNGFCSQNTEGDTRLFYIHAAKMEPPKSWQSENEAKAIKKVMSVLDIEDEDYIILAPYKKQVQLLGKFLPEQRNNLKILTVHGSQGREWHTVILSITDTSDRWFVDSTLLQSKGLNLLNTAISRARKQLVIVCDYQYWQYQQGQLVTELLSISKPWEMQERKKEGK